MTRHFLFKHYWWIAILCAAAGITLVFRLADEDRLPLVGSIVVGALGFCYFVMQQKLAEIALFKQLFTEFNQRYDVLNDQLTEVMEGKRVGREEKQVVVDYFNLCAEEYLFFSEGYIHRTVWRTWCRGMLWYLGREPFRSIWEEEIRQDSYYGLSFEKIEAGAR